MLKTLCLGAALWMGQTDAPSAPRARLLPPIGARVIVEDAEVPSRVIVDSTDHQAPRLIAPASFSGIGFLSRPLSGLLGGANGDGHGGSSCGRDCDSCCEVTWLKRWKCEDLEMKPVEHKHACNSCGFLHGLLWCPKEEEKGNGTDDKKDEKKNGKEEKKEEKKDGNGDKAEEAPDLNPLMQAIKCRFPTLFEQLDCRGVKIYGWLNFGYTFNVDSPNDRLNVGANFNNRSNDFTWNQLPYIVLEKTLDLDKKKDELHAGFRVDLSYGHDAPHWANSGLGLFDHFTGSRLQSPRTHELGLDMPQFYLDIHTPILTDRGVDWRFGRMFTHQTFELSPATSNYFYSHSYEYFYGMPFTHFGAMATVHLGDTVDVMNGIARGWENVFQDNNDTPCYIGSYVWNSCDKRQNFAFTWCYGPEQLQNNHNDRTTLTAYYTRKFGGCNQWMWVAGGCLGWEQNAAMNNEGALTTAEWQAVSTYLFYTVNPKLTLGTRFEWFRDDDGVRVTYFNDQALDATRLGSAGNYFDWTVGFTYKPYQNLRVRPEVRFDWFDGPVGAPYNDRTDRFQTTLGLDVIWEF